MGDLAPAMEMLVNGKQKRGHNFANRYNSQSKGLKFVEHRDLMDEYIVLRYVNACV
jgi:hypothetical protein